MADQLASARLMALAGQGESALATFEELFGGLPEEESLQLEYARIASAVPDKQAVAKRIYEQLTRSDSPVISNTARSRIYRCGPRICGSRSGSGAEITSG